MKIVFCFFIIVSMFGCASRSSTDQATSAQTATSHSRLTAKSFHFIGPSTTLQQVFDKCGQAKGPIASLLIGWYFYDLSDGTQVSIVVSLKDYSILGVTHQTKDGHVIDTIYTKK